MKRRTHFFNAFLTMLGDQVSLAKGAIYQSLGLFFVFALHRVLALEFLSEVPLSGDKWARAMLVGWASDFWIASLWVFVLILVAALLRGFGLRKAARVIPESGVWLFALIVTIHQPYVEFFRHQVVPMHVKYLWDPDFVTSSYKSAWSPSIGLLVGLSLMLFALGPWLWRMARSRLNHQADHSSNGRKVRLWWAAYGVLIVAAIVVHNRNIRYRVQWFIPSELQVHMIERLYFHWRANPLPEALSVGEKDVLAKAFALPEQVAVRELVDRITFSRVKDGVPSPEGQLLKLAYDEKLKDPLGPLVLVVLMESLRPGEVGAYHPDGKVSITPRLDQFAKNALVFERAYATGGVTRSGQEAVFCGYQSSANHSMMRERPDVQLDCLPDIFRGESFWFHGGRGEFDNQLQFWRRHQVRQLVSQDSFLESDAKSDWGVSDLVLMNRSLVELDRMTKDQAQPMLGMILTVTNHIPWKIPEDAPISVASEGELLEEEKFGTTLYADDALGQLIEGLKKRPVWQRTLLIVVSDHGVTGKTYHRLKPKPPHLNLELRSHIVLMLGGGIIESAGLAGVRNDDYVSQADIAPTIAWLHGYDDFRSMGELLLSKRRLRPVVSDLGTDVYFPAFQMSFDHASQKAVASPSLPTAHFLALSYYRSFLHAINHL